MAKKIIPEEYINQHFVNKINEKFVVLTYLFKEGSNHCYDIKFIETNNIQMATLNQIRKGTCIDLVQRKKVKKLKTELELKERNRLIKKHKNEIEFKALNTHYKTIISIDLSSLSTGMAIAVKNEIRASKVIQIKEDDFYKRCEKMVDAVLSVIRKCEVDLVIIEDIYLGLNSGVLTKLAELRGMLHYNLIKLGIEVIYINANIWKHQLNLGTNRSEQKKQSIIIANEIMSKDIKTDDEADAVCMLKAVINLSSC